MKRVIIAISAIFLVACTNKQSPTSLDSKESKDDSLLVVQRQDSIERENIFKALGDTAFSGVCYGMNKLKYQKAFEAFKKTLKIEEDYFDFELVGYKFHGDDGLHVEKNNEKSVDGYPYGLDNILKEDRLWTYFYKDKLFSIRWDSRRTIQDEGLVKYSLGKLVSLFEKKYGKPNINNTDRFNSPIIETGVWHQMKVISRWETEKRKIVIFYRELVGSERDKWMEENYPSYYQYKLEIQFLDKARKKEVDEYIKPILQKFTDEKIEKMKQDSIKNANAL
jgi:hypothetical protein